jgi:hypothetical protein
MAASFKIPMSLKRKAKKDPELPKFEWKLFIWVHIPIGKYKGKPAKW